MIDQIDGTRPYQILKAISQKEEKQAEVPPSFKEACETFYQLVKCKTLSDKVRIQPKVENVQNFLKQEQTLEIDALGVKISYSIWELWTEWLLPHLNISNSFDLIGSSVFYLLGSDFFRSWISELIGPCSSLFETLWKGIPQQPNDYDFRFEVKIDSEQALKRCTNQVLIYLCEKVQKASAIHPSAIRRAVFKSLNNFNYVKKESVHLAMISFGPFDLIFWSRLEPKYLSTADNLQLQIKTKPQLSLELRSDGDQFDQAVVDRFRRYFCPNPSKHLNHQAWLRSISKKTKGWDIAPMPREEEFIKKTLNEKKSLIEQFNKLLASHHKNSTNDAISLAFHLSCSLLKHDLPLVSLWDQFDRPSSIGTLFQIWEAMCKKRISFRELLNELQREAFLNQCFLLVDQDVYISIPISDADIERIVKPLSHTNNIRLKNLGWKHTKLIAERKRGKKKWEWINQTYAEYFNGGITTVCVALCQLDVQSVNYSKKKLESMLLFILKIRSDFLQFVDYSKYIKEIVQLFTKSFPTLNQKRIRGKKPRDFEKLLKDFFCILEEMGKTELALELFDKTKRYHCITDGKFYNKILINHLKLNPFKAKEAQLNDLKQCSIDSLLDLVLIFSSNGHTSLIQLLHFIEAKKKKLTPKQELQLYQGYYALIQISSFETCSDKIAKSSLNELDKERLLRILLNQGVLPSDHLIPVLLTNGQRHLLICMAKEILQKKEIVEEEIHFLHHLVKHVPSLLVKVIPHLDEIQIKGLKTIIHKNLDSIFSQCGPEDTVILWNSIKFLFSNVNQLSQTVQDHLIYAVEKAPRTLNSDALARFFVLINKKNFVPRIEALYVSYLKEALRVENSFQAKHWFAKLYRIRKISKELEWLIDQGKYYWAEKLIDVGDEKAFWCEVITEFYYEKKYDQVNHIILINPKKWIWPREVFDGFVEKQGGDALNILLHTHSKSGPLWVRVFSSIVDGQHYSIAQKCALYSYLRDPLERLSLLIDDKNSRFQCWKLVLRCMIQFDNDIIFEMLSCSDIWKEETKLVKQGLEILFQKNKDIVSIALPLAYQTSSDSLEHWIKYQCCLFFLKNQKTKEALDLIVEVIEANLRWSTEEINMIVTLLLDVPANELQDNPSFEIFVNYAQQREINLSKKFLVRLVLRTSSHCIPNLLVLCKKVQLSNEEWIELYQEIYMLHGQITLFQVLLECDPKAEVIFDLFSSLHDSNVDLSHLIESAWVLYPDIDQVRLQFFLMKLINHFFSLTSEQLYQKVPELKRLLKFGNNKTRELFLNLSIRNFVRILDCKELNLNLYPLYVDEFAKMSYTWQKKEIEDLFKEKTGVSARAIFGFMYRYHKINHDKTTRQVLRLLWKRVIKIYFEISPNVYLLELESFSMISQLYFQFVSQKNDELTLCIISSYLFQIFCETKFPDNRKTRKVLGDQLLEFITRSAKLLEDKSSNYRNRVDYNLISLLGKVILFLVDFKITPSQFEKIIASLIFPKRSEDWIQDHMTSTIPMLVQGKYKIRSSLIDENGLVPRNKLTEISYRFTLIDVIIIWVFWCLTNHKIDLVETLLIKLSALLKSSPRLDQKNLLERIISKIKAFQKEALEQMQNSDNKNKKRKQKRRRK